MIKRLLNVIMSVILIVLYVYVMLLVSDAMGPKHDPIAFNLIFIGFGWVAVATLIATIWHIARLIIEYIFDLNKCKFTANDNDYA